MNKLQRRKNPNNTNEKKSLKSCEKNENFEEKESLKSFTNQNLLLSLLILFRIINALCTKTYFNPDEYWQSVEVGHYMIYAPRIFQAIFAAIGDLYTYRLARKLFNDPTANWTLFCSIISWFNFFCSIRTLSNSIETVLTIIALYYWPWPTFSNLISWNDRIKMLRVSLSLAAVCCILRPTNAIIWGFLGIHLLWKTKEHLTSIILNTLFITILSILAMTLTDYTFYGEIVFVPMKFLYVNVVQSISLFYGSHPWHWYLSQGIPFITTTLMPFVLKGIYDLINNRHLAHQQSIKTLIWLMAFVIFCYSLLSHKEFRFIYPLLPIMIICAGYCLQDISLKYQKKIRFVVIFLVLTNVPVAYYTNFVHQRGVVDVLNYLRNEAELGKVREIGFLMPCHSTPYYSNLHFNISMFYLSCDPPLNRDQVNYVDEADQFYANPHEFLIKNFHSISSSSEKSIDSKLRKWPNYLVIFEALLNDLTPFLKDSNYKEFSDNVSFDDSLFDPPDNGDLFDSSNDDSSFGIFIPFNNDETT
ncbi:2949_t:CDS:2, partial [Funneliformis mosseae]